MRILDKQKIAYTTKAYEYSEDDLSGVHAAAALGMDPEQVFKTLVGQGNKTGPVVFCIPSDKELDLKKAAACSGNKSVQLLHVKDLPGLTGYIRGGCSPIGMKKKFPTYIEEMKKKGHQNLLSRKLVLGALSLFDDEYPIAISFNNKEFYWLKDMQIDE